MLRTVATLSLLTAMAGSSFGQTTEPDFPGYDISRFSYTHLGGMDFDDRAGELKVDEFILRSVIARPFSFANCWTFVPTLQVAQTSLNFDGTTPGFAIHDEDLWAVSLGGIAISAPTGSPWMYAIWARATAASDLQEFGSDSFTFDIAGGPGYRFNPDLTVGLGLAVLNLNGDTKVYPGPFLDWQISDAVRLGIYGPEVTAVWSIAQDWRVSLRGEPNGGDWNFRDDNGDSRLIDLSSYRVGLHLDRRVVGNLWFGGGAGFTFANEIEYQSGSGKTISSEDLETGAYGFLGFRLNTW